MVVADNTALTYRYERWRAVFAGMLETAGSTFMLLIVVKWFVDAGAITKALVAAGSSVGLLMSPVVVKWVENGERSITQSISQLFLLGAACCLVMAAFPNQVVFTVGTLLAMAVPASVVPLFTQLYQENYPAEKRGRLFSRTIMIRIFLAALFSDLAGRALSGRMHLFPLLLVVFAVAFVASAFLVRRCPSKALQRTAGSHPFRALRFVREDRVFRMTLICWMLMGFANLMMYPMRVEYLANPKYNLALSVSTIALLTGVIPNLARLVMSPIWGWLFDRMNFFLLRVVLNVGFAMGILTFFLSTDMSGLAVGGIIFGVSLAGGDVAWSLWVTKFAPPERVADYMSVHTFFTGVRGVLAPLVAFQALAHCSIAFLGWISAALIVIASLMLLPEIKWGRTARKASALVEDVSE